MKLLQLTLGFLFLFTVTSCVTTLPLNHQFYNSKKVGIIIQVDSIGITKAGGQGLLDMALTSGNKFREPLKKVEPKFFLKETLKSEITLILNEKNKQFQFIEQKIDNINLTKFERPNSAKKYSKIDFRTFKTLNNVDEIMFVKVKYGILVNYYGMIELDKQGYVNIESEIVDLSDNSLLEHENYQTAAKINGNWKEGEDFENLKNAIQYAIKNSIEILKTKF